MSAAAGPAAGPAAAVAATAAPTVRVVHTAAAAAVATFCARRLLLQKGNDR